MARKPVLVNTAPLRATFFIIKAGADLGHGIEVKEESDGTRTAQLSATEAQYWLDQGVISTVKPAIVQERRDSRRQEAEKQTAALKTEPAVSERRPLVASEAAGAEDPADRFSGGRRRPTR